MRFVISLMLATVTLAGCASEAPREETATEANAALSDGDAYTKLLKGKTYKSGHAECGRTLTLNGAFGHEGTYLLADVPCGENGEASTNGVFRSKGHFEVIGGWLGGLLTNPTLKLTPATAPEEDPGVPFTYKIKDQGEFVTIETPTGTLVPEAFLD